MYDLLIIGSGPGGYVAAIRAGQLGLKVGVVEKHAKLGGVCLHVGCIPTKALLYSADVYEIVLDPEEHGISCENVKLDWSRVQERKDKIVAKHAKGIEFLFKKHKVETIAGYGCLKGGGVRNSAGRTTGSRTTNPSAQGHPASAPNCASRLSMSWRNNGVFRRVAAVWGPGG